VRIVCVEIGCDWFEKISSLLTTVGLLIPTTCCLNLDNNDVGPLVDGFVVV
jgi:hypothetical protein